MDGSRGPKDFRTEPAAGLENTNMDFPAGGKIKTISVVYRSPASRAYIHPHAALSHLE